MSIDRGLLHGQQGYFDPGMHALLKEHCRKTGSTLQRCTCGIYFVSARALSQGPQKRNEYDYSRCCECNGRMKDRRAVSRAWLDSEAGIQYRQEYYKANSSTIRERLKQKKFRPKLLVRETGRIRHNGITSLA